MQINKLSNMVVCEPYQFLESTHVLTEGELRLLGLTLGSIYQVGVLEDRIYDVDLELYQELTGCKSKKVAYEVFKEAALLLLARVCVLKADILKQDADKDTMVASQILSQAYYNPTTATIQIRFSEMMIEMFSNLGENNPYAKYPIWRTMALKGTNSYRLMRLLNKWKKYGTWYVEVEEFKRLMGFEPYEYREFKELNRRVLVPSLKNIVEDYGIYAKLDISSAKCKLGRKIVKIGFTDIIDGKEIDAERVAMFKKTKKLNKEAFKEIEKMAHPCATD